jgi:hypothetical protein
MQIELQPGKRTSDRDYARSPAGGLMILRTLMMVPGVFATLNAMAVYPLLNARPAMTFLLSGFLLPVALQIASTVRNRPGNDGGRALRIAYACSSLALVSFGLLLFLNGKLDRSPANDVKTTVLEKTTFRGRATQYHLIVSSWRQGTERQDMNVSSKVFDRVAVGKAVTVEMHDGFFGFSWYGRISPG